MKAPSSFSPTATARASHGAAQAIVTLIGTDAKALRHLGRATPLLMRHGLLAKTTASDRIYRRLALRGAAIDTACITEKRRNNHD